MQGAPGAIAWRTLCQLLALTGACQRSPPTGGSANGMPLNTAIVLAWGLNAPCNLPVEISSAIGGAAWTGMFSNMSIIGSRVKRRIARFSTTGITCLSEFVTLKQAWRGPHCGPLGSNAPNRKTLVKRHSIDCRLLDEV
jgi:hypothetical protein